MIATFFASAEEFRYWLMANHQTASELIVGYYKVATGKPSMTWSESVDQALCFGWIDGVRRTIDAESYCIRFTPRRANSIWSGVNIKKVEQLTAEGLMQEAGILAFSKRKAEKSGIYSFEIEVQDLSEEYSNQFKTNTKAWAFFNSLAPSYKKNIVHWIMSAKQKSTQLSRLEKAISESEKSKRAY